MRSPQSCTQKRCSSGLWRLSRVVRFFFTRPMAPGLPCVMSAMELTSMPPVACCASLRRWSRLVLSQSKSTAATEGSAEAARNSGSSMRLLMSSSRSTTAVAGESDARRSGGGVAAAAATSTWGAGAETGTGANTGAAASATRGTTSTFASASVAGAGAGAEGSAAAAGCSSTGLSGVATGVGTGVVSMSSIPESREASEAGVSG
mmetsp:Transcript_72770/g.229237  ORF Transcript_72770/g.229237 Transcript_72770/m.229237 type:complete len:205 (+) Transcript_72770:595-1209(+)